MRHHLKLHERRSSNASLCKKRELIQGSNINEISGLYLLNQILFSTNLFINFKLVQGNSIALDQSLFLRLFVS